MSVPKVINKNKLLLGIQGGREKDKHRDIVYQSLGGCLSDADDEL